MGNEESGAAAESQPVDYTLQWEYPGQWFDELGASHLGMGVNSAIGMDMLFGETLSRQNREDMGLSIIKSGAIGYDQ